MPKTKAPAPRVSLNMRLSRDEHDEHSALAQFLRVSLTQLVLQLLRKKRQTLTDKGHDVPTKPKVER
jgi:hypothetical protein